MWKYNANAHWKEHHKTGCGKMPASFTVTKKEHIEVKAAYALLLKKLTAPSKKKKSKESEGKGKKTQTPQKKKEKKKKDEGEGGEGGKEG